MAASPEENVRAYRARSKFAIASSILVLKHSALNQRVQTQRVGSCYLLGFASLA